MLAPAFKSALITLWLFDITAQCKAVNSKYNSHILVIAILILLVCHTKVEKKMVALEKDIIQAVTQATLL